MQGLTRVDRAGWELHDRHHEQHVCDRKSSQCGENGTAVADANEERDGSGGYP